MILLLSITILLKCVTSCPIQLRITYHLEYQYSTAPSTELIDEKEWITYALLNE